MRTKDLHPGDLLVWGKRADIDRGKGTIAICLAVGRYTTAHQPCGVVAVAHPRASNGVVIARPRARHIGRPRADEWLGPSTQWEVAVVSAGSLVPFDVWRLKRDALNEIIEMDREHEREGERIAAETKVIVSQALGLPVDTVRFYQHHIPDRCGPQVVIPVEELDKLLAREHPVAWEKVNAVKDRWCEWRARPVPSSCPR